MLHWFAGAKTQDVGDVDATGYIEPPETPAPVFAVRAFKHAIFGTPATAQPKPKALRRHSNTENGKARSNARPAMARPKSSGDTHTLAGYAVADDDEPMPMPSPTKGILMTPGTAAARRKTVSFGAHVLDNEGKRPGKSGLPDSCPGKFPSPFVKSTVAEDSEVQSTGKARGRNKLTEKLEQVRDDSAKRKSVSAKNFTEPDKETDVASDLTELGPEHLRIMFEQYRQNSERECRKLVAKQRAAKSFAREKDVQLMETADQLRQEKKKVDRLERQVAELQAQLSEYQEKLRASEAEEQSAKEEITRLKRSSGTGYRRHGDFPTAASPRTHYSVDKPERETVLKTRTSRERLVNHDTKGTKTGESGDATVRPKARPRHQSEREHEDVWAPPLAPSSLIPSKPETLPTSPSARTSRPSTTTAPLKPLDLNTLPQESLSLATSMGMQPPSPLREARQDSPMRSPPTRSRPKPSEKLSVVVPESSPFLPDSENERPNVLTGTPVPIMSPIRAKAQAARENSSPTLKASRRPNHENLDPKSGVRSPAAGKSEMDEVMEAARLNLANRGRKVS